MERVEYDMRQPIVQETHLRQTPNEDVVKFLKARIACGICICLPGIVEIIMISKILDDKHTDQYVCHDRDYRPYGFIPALFAIITSAFAPLMKRKRCGVNPRCKSVAFTFLVLCIITAVISVAGLTLFATQTECIKSYSDYNLNNHSSDTPEEDRLYLTLHVIVCALFAFQMLMSILGASFTSGAVCSSGNSRVRHVIVCHPQRLVLPRTINQRVYPTIITRSQQPSNQSQHQDLPPPYSLFDPQGSR